MSGVLHFGSGAASEETHLWKLMLHRPVSELDPDQVDLLFVGGGNTFRLLDQVRRAGFLDAVRRFDAAGGDYYGRSAGAVLACGTTCRFSACRSQSGCAASMREPR